MSERLRIAIAVGSAVAITGFAVSLAVTPLLQRLCESSRDIGRRSESTVPQADVPQAG
ncbi:hypothetical protein KIH77_06775 [Bifidobacterium sp. 82T24]|uniref:hypothetical protein n=1 Tax=Bifidobacterium pluvialisilvae TaxID=2834436 RepID=UPI001C5855F1|nr:hypothetical protein [Bifidobacterium pluvialisilvae]MBW3088432.1 hypothetical protein [Bifidobacterium pluvialisilvae]